MNLFSENTARTVVWFSCGACSTLSLKYALNEHADTIAVYCDTGGEHPDNLRFLHDVEQLFGIHISILKNPKYENHFDVLEKLNFIRDEAGAPCTGLLKKQLRFEFERVDDLQVFGYASNELKRASKFDKSFFYVNTYYPLIAHNITKKQALGWLSKQNIELPAMYKLGYKNNNCIGCVKGGKGYWNRIRRDFPEAFERMAKHERRVNFSMNDKFLDEMEPTEGDMKEEVPSCDFTCNSIINL